jgi:hypothetical protein
MIYTFEKKPEILCFEALETSDCRVNNTQKNIYLILIFTLFLNRKKVNWLTMN